MDATLPYPAGARYGDGVAAKTHGPGGANAVLGMLIFVACELMFFAGLISAFVVLRNSVTLWPPADQPRFPASVTAVNTLVLLASGATMIAGRGAIRRGQVAAAATWIGGTAVLGATFLAVQGIEWARLLAHGLRVAQGIYGGLFVALIGAHAAHVCGGLGAVLWAWRGARDRRWSPQRHDAVTAVQIYWLLVVGVWPVLYALVYAG